MLQNPIFLKIFLIMQNIYKSASDSVQYSPSSSDTDSCWLSSTSSSDKDSSCSVTSSDSGMVSWSSGASCGSVSSSSSDVSATN